MNTDVEKDMLPQTIKTAMNCRHCRIQSVSKMKPSIVAGKRGYSLVILTKTVFFPLQGFKKSAAHQLKEFLHLLLVSNMPLAAI